MDTKYKIMKNILKITSFVFALFVAFSCTNEKEFTASANGFQARLTEGFPTTNVLLEASNADTFVKFQWDRSDNGVPTSVIYSIIVSDHDNDPDFSDGVESFVGIDVNSNDARKCELKVGEFNTIMNRLPSFTCNTMNIDIRVKSKLGVSTNALIQYSNPMTISVKGYPTSRQILAFVKEGSSASDSQKLASTGVSSFSDYEGYCYLTPGNYKVYRPDACGDFSNATVYGIGTLSSSGTANLVDDQSQSFAVAEAGHYYIKASISTGTGTSTCTIKNYRAFGPFGDATRAPGGASVNAIVPMTYDVAKNKWSVTMDLIKGKNFRFKSNLWQGDIVTPVGEPFPSPPYVPTGSSAPSFTSIISTLGDPNGTGTNLESVTLLAGNIKVPGTFNNGETAKYVIEIDLSKPRDYKYKLVAVPN